MASIQKRSNGRWAVRWRDQQGTQRWQTFATKSEANAFKRSLDRTPPASPTTPVAPAVPTAPLLRDYATTWAARQLWRPTTSAQVESYMRRHILPRFGDRSLDSITAGDIQLWIRQLSDTHRSSSVRLIVAHLRSLFNEAVRDGLVQASPARLVRLPQRDDVPTRPPTPDQVRQLRQLLPERHRAIVSLVAGTGLRQGEALGLTLDRVDRAERVIHVDRQLAQPPTPGLFAPTKTRTSMRTLPVTDGLLDALDEHVERFGLGECGLIFTDEDGGRLLRRKVSKVWSPAIADVGLPPRTGVHCLRHFYASLLIRSGCSVKVVQARLGHATAKETLDTYSHLWPDDEDRTRSALSALELRWSRATGSDGPD